MTREARIVLAALLGIGGMIALYLLGLPDDPGGVDEPQRASTTAFVAGMASTPWMAPKPPQEAPQAAQEPARAQATATVVIRREEAPRERQEASDEQEEPKRGLGDVVDSVIRVPLLY